MALHTGEAELREGDYYGTAVNRCARLRGVGHGGQVLLSQATADAGARRPAAGRRPARPGRAPPQDLTRPERVFQLGRTGPAGRLPAAREPRRAADTTCRVQATPLIGRERDGRARSALCCCATTSGC